MRYDIPIYFQKITQGAYDPDTGNYGPDSITETLRYASVMDTGRETLRLVYGEIRQGSLSIQIQGHYAGDFDWIRIGSKVYSVDDSRNLRTKQTFVVSEVQ